MSLSPFLLPKAVVSQGRLCLLNRNAYFKQHVYAKENKKKSVKISEKINLLDRMKEGESRQQIVQETGIGLRTIERMVASEADIRMSAATSSPKTMKRKRTGKSEEVDAALAAWFTSVRN